MSRGAILATLPLGMDGDPGRRPFRVESFAAFSLVLFAACSGAPNDGAPGVGETADALTGRLVVYVATYADRKAEKRYYLLGPDGNKQRLLFEKAPSVAPRTNIAISGSTEGDAIRVTSYRVIRPADDLGTV